MKTQSNITTWHRGRQLLLCGFTSCAAILGAQNSSGEENVSWGISTAPASGAGVAFGGTNHLIFVRTAGMPAGGSNLCFNISIKGLDIGTILLNASDLDKDGKATLAELKTVAAASFKLWDTNSDGSLSGTELSAALKELFPAPPPGARFARRVINGEEIEVSPDELPTPDVMLAKRITANADANSDSSLSAQELDDFLDKHFTEWDRDAGGSLNATELSEAFGQLARPE